MLPLTANGFGKSFEKFIVKQDLYYVSKQYKNEFENSFFAKIFAQLKKM